ncbi:MAG: hypothetical protein NTY09_08930 [bacterium]|nr:hypothetical protein [bacterium]
MNNQILFIGTVACDSGAWIWEVYVEVVVVALVVPVEDCREIFL